MLLMNGGTVYLRDAKSSEWIESKTLDSLIINLYQIESDKNSKAPIICITEKAIATLALPSDGGNMGVEEVSKLSGKAVKAQLSEKSHNNSNVLIMTHDGSSYCLWSLTDTLQLNKLLQGGLDVRSFFGFVEVGGQTLESESQQVTQTALLCSSGDFSNSKRSLSLYVQKAPENN